MPGFTHLHTTSGFSLRYGASHPECLAERASERGRIARDCGLAPEALFPVLDQLEASSTRGVWPLAQGVCAGSCCRRAIGAGGEIWR